MNPWEILAAGFGLANIALLARRSVWNYPAGMVMVAILAFVFLQSRLYAVAGLQIFFFAAQAQGLWAWAKAPQQDGAVAVRRLPARGWPIVLGGGVAASVMLALILRQTDAAAPWGDASIAGWSVVAQLLINGRYLESWPIWVGINFLSIGLYAGQSLWVTAGLSAVFLIGAIIGWRSWQRVAA